ncbi:hypothetical protein [Nisaea nitritireducens]|uniref:hypothetical protein n=1 Tax=Nisaea nitritireducens TaxID=568392 RepID=UPI0018679478|nr:hypothetical protein [Nisaea nitritireducens]
MIEYLIEREREENFRTSTRMIKFPDGETRRVEAYRLVWTWFDRALAFEFGPKEAGILNTVLECATEEGLPIDQALGRVVDYYVRRWEARGLDLTDHNPQLTLARRRMQRFQERKGS